VIARLVFRLPAAPAGHQWWFAWHPVTMPDGKRVWLRWVLRYRLDDYRHG
jgi:hypothetical protein